MEVILSRKWAKSRTRGLKRHLTRAKARVGRARQTRADLEQQLKACRREIAQARERLVEAMKQQTATSEMLRIISTSPIQSVLDAVAENAARLCNANNARIFRLEDNLLRLVASYGEILLTSHGHEPFPANRDTVTGRATCDRRTIHVHDLAAEDNEYPVGSRAVKSEGYHTSLATPLLREGTPTGVILVRRLEVRPFPDSQIALLKTFADQAVIAIALRESTEALRRSEAYLAEAQRLSHTGSWASNLKAILYCSEESYRIFGFDPLLGLPSREAMSQRIHPDDRGRVSEVAREALRQKRNYAVEYRIVLPDGTIKYLEATAHHRFSADGELVEVIGTNVDVSERKRAQEELEKLRQLEADLAHLHRLSMMGELAASLAHEVKQPIATARNNACAALNFLDTRTPDLGEVREALGCVVDDADRAGHIVDRVRGQIKKAPPRKDRFDLNGAVNEVILLARSAITGNGVSVQTRLAEEIISVHGDRVQLQVLCRRPRAA
jgi:PAS domain S-box-containing protein